MRNDQIVDQMLTWKEELLPRAKRLLELYREICGRFPEDAYPTGKFDATETHILIEICEPGHFGGDDDFDDFAVSRAVFNAVDEEFIRADFREELRERVERKRLERLEDAAQMEKADRALYESLKERFGGENA